MTDQHGSLDGADGEDCVDEALHDELRTLARATLRRSRLPLDATELVHRAWLRLAEQFRGLSRGELLGLCALNMRRVLVDEARRRWLERRDVTRVTLSGLAADEAERSVDLIDLDAALVRLELVDERWARVVELRFFGGLSIEEVAGALDVAPRTVDRDWRLARAWLKRELELE